MSDGDRAHREHTLRLLEQARETETIPFDGAAFWRRLAIELGRRFPSCANDAGCIAWLIDHCGDQKRSHEGGEQNEADREADRKRFKRWSQGTRPRWENVYPLCAAINVGSPDKPKLTAADLVADLPLHKPGGDGPGAPPPDDPFGDELSRLAVKVEAALKSAPVLTAALLGKGHGDPAAREASRSVACALVDAQVQTLAADLADLAARFDRERNVRERDVARDLLWEILPLAVDWRALVLEARAAQDGHALELPLRTETLAEVRLAGVHRRACQFVSREHPLPRGMLLVPLPALAHGPFFDPRGEGLADAVLDNLHEEEVFPKLRQRFPRLAQFRVAAKERLKGSPASKSVHYLLVIDDDLDPQQTRDLDGSWKIAKSALAQALPGLHLVRLTGRDPELEKEMGLVTLIQDLCHLE